MVPGVDIIYDPIHRERSLIDMLMVERSFLEISRLHILVVYKNGVAEENRENDWKLSEMYSFNLTIFSENFMKW